MSNQINSLYDLFSLRAEQQGEDPAFFTPTTLVTYQEFLRQVDAIAAGLHHHGLESGQRIATLAKNSVLHFAVLVAGTRLGAVVFPVNWRLASNELAQAIDLVEPAALFIEPEFHPPCAELDLSSISLKVHLGEESLQGFVPIAETFRSGQPPKPAVQPNHPAAIIATAAVAGLPRGAVLTHANLLSVGQMFANAYHLTKSDRYLGVLPFFHIAGLEYIVVMAAAGGASVILPGFDAELGSHLIDQHQVSLLVTFPPMLDQLIESKQQNRASWDSLRICWGILNPPEIVQKYLDLERGDYWTGYGQTETTGIATLMNYQDKPGSAGRVVDGLQIRIVDDTDQELPPNQVGEIVVCGNLVYAHYWRDEEASAYASRDGWHHTGDLGKLDPDGFLFYAGRKPEKELIKSGGENIYPAEVEAAIRQLTQVADVCVIGVPDNQWGETVKAVVELAEGQQLNASQLQAGISEHLAAFKKPRLVVFVPRLPRDPQGKIDRLKVKADHG